MKGNRNQWSENTGDDHSRLEVEGDVIVRQGSERGAIIEKEVEASSDADETKEENDDGLEVLGDTILSQESEQDAIIEKEVEASSDTD